MPTTMAITLTANLESTVGSSSAGTVEPGYLRITLCGFGPQIPSVPGTAVIGDAGVPQLVGPQTSTSSPLTVTLYGNDVIVPANTFYEVAVLDMNKNVIQSGLYQFTGSGVIDLSNAQQILPPFNLGFVVTKLKYAAAPGAVPGSTYTAPGTVVAVVYNGVLLDPAYYTIAGNVITLTFTTEVGDKINALYIGN